jgi:predicted amidophosphoribosyltransferase
LRFENMQEVFSVKYPERLANKHILLVDDVVTTGATLEACGIELLKIPGVKLSIATIAYAE